MRKKLLILLALSITFIAKAHDTNAINFTFNHLALSLKDIDRSADFYKMVLSLTEITNRTKMEGIRWFSLEKERSYI